MHRGRSLLCDRHWSETDLQCKCRQVGNLLLQPNNDDDTDEFASFQFEFATRKCGGCCTVAVGMFFLFVAFSKVLRRVAAT